MNVGSGTLADDPGSRAESEQNRVTDAETRGLRLQGAPQHGARDGLAMGPTPCD